MLGAPCKYVQCKVSLIFQAACIQAVCHGYGISSEWLRSRHTFVKFYMVTFARQHLQIFTCHDPNVLWLSHLVGKPQFILTQKIPTSVVTNIPADCVCPGLVCGSGATSHLHKYKNKHKLISHFINIKGLAATDGWRIQTESVILLEHDWSWKDVSAP